MKRYLTTIAMLCVGVGAADSNTLTIVDNGDPRAVISIPLNASEQVADAAGLLSEYVEKGTGAKVSVGEDVSGDDNSIVIHVGADEFVRHLNLDVSDLDVDGFTIAFSGQSDIAFRDIVILGRTDWGTEFGVYEFLERYLDIRWLMPGPDGEDVPHHDSLVIPAVDVRDKPAMISRGFLNPN